MNTHTICRSLTRTHTLAAGALAGLALLATGCQNPGAGVSLPHPEFVATSATLPATTGAATTNDNAKVNLLATNPTDAPLWLRSLNLALTDDATAADDAIARGSWEGDRQIDPGGSVLLDLSIPMVAGAELPEEASTGVLAVEAGFARSGVIGVLGGQTRSYTLPITLATGSTARPKPAE